MSLYYYRSSLIGIGIYVFCLFVCLCLARRCAATVSGDHEPNVILKDNDLKYKIRLPTQVSTELFMQLEWDANFLLSIGVMDYSLLCKTYLYYSIIIIVVVLYCMIM